jgi:hypothetical protein
MSKNPNLRQILAALADSIEAQNSTAFLDDPMSFVEKIPKRSLTGEHILGGKILEFASSGITDKATKEQLVITNGGITVSRINGTLDIENELKVPLITANKVKVDVLEVKELIADIKFEKNEPIKFSGDNLYGQGLLWAGSGYTKQFIFSSGPDKFFSSESIDLGKDKNLSINNVVVLNDKELGPSVTKSSLREVGRLKGLIVDGSFSVNQYLFYNGSADRLGLGTEEPNAALAIAEDGIEVLLGTRDSTRGIVGTFASNGLDIITDNKPRISVGAGGNIDLGNTNQLPIKVTVHGTLGINVSTPDTRAELHVAGAIKFNDKIHLSGTTPPQGGNFNVGDIVWNSNPQQRQHVGWVCTVAGNPGIWNAFGEIK